MSNTGAHFDRPVRAQLGSGDFEFGVTAIERLCRTHRSAIGRCRFAGKARQRLLYGLEFSQWPAELLAFIGIGDRQGQRRVQSARNLTGAGKGHCQLGVCYCCPLHDELRQVDAKGVIAGQAKDCQRIEPGAAEAALRFGNQKVWQSELFQPSNVTLDSGCRTHSREKRIDHFSQHAARVTHLRPNPRAIIPRMISRVPPRSEKLGLTCSR